MQQRQPNRIIVSHHHSQQLIKKKRANSVIHITIGLPKLTQSINNHRQPLKHEKQVLTNKNVVFIFNVI